MAIVRDFRDLHVYQQAFAAAQRIYELIKRFPADERYSLTDQARRASRSVCTNIGEAWRKRRYPAAFVSKLSDADAEATETTIWLDFALSFGFLKLLDHDDVLDLYDQINRQLFKMMDRPQDWCNTMRKPSKVERDS